MGEISVYNETKAILEKYKIRANKDLGQNFLIDDNIVNTIITSANIEKEDLIIEIGPGLGVLTKLLIEKSDNVLAVELDKKMVEILENRFSEDKNLQIINEDILKIDLEKLVENIKTRKEIKKVKVVANLPYYISTPIIMKLLEEKIGIDEIIVMVQKEVAERLTARTGEKLAGAITYAVEYYSEATKIIDVPKESFIPSPKVESAVIKLELRKQPKVITKNEKLLFEIIQKSFSQRRKTLANALINNNIVKSRQEAEEILTNIGIDINIRGEKLTLEQFAQIVELL